MDWVFRRYLTRDLYQPHTWWGFDGPYTRMQMEDGSSFIMIMSSVWRARTRPHLCHISYSPLPGVSTKSSASHKTSSETYTASTSNEVEAFLCDFYPDAMDAKRRKRDDSHQHAVAAYTLSAKIPEQDASFTLKVDGGAQSYTHKFTHPGTRQKLDLEVRISDNTPHSLLGPMWIGRFLPIPLKWHIFSTRSQTIITIRDREAGGRVLMEKKGLAHQEKNWGIGFPSAWIWCQGFSTPAAKGSLAIAGGALTSFLQSFMIAYRSPTSTRNWDFGPATSMRLFGIGPFVSLSKCSSKEGEVVLDCTNPFRGQRISIRGKADSATFQQMSAPLPRGHTPEYCHETFQATYNIKLFERQGWFGQYKLVEETTMDNSALEFGGDWSHWWTERKRE